ncbi:MAG: hypothetical protein ACO4CH_08425 [Saprospiraceae bacterium]
MRKFLLLSALSLSISAFSNLTIAQSLDDILQNYYEVIGDADDWARLGNLRMTGTALAQGFSIPMTMHQARPNKMRMEMDIQGQKMIQAFDGETAWGLNPMAGQTEPTKGTDEENKQSAAQSVFEDELVNYQEKGHTAQLDGTEEIEGTMCFRVALTKKDGMKMTYFIDQETYALVMYRTAVDSGPMKGQAIESYLSDYQEVEGVMMPHSIEQKVSGMTMWKMVVDRMEANVDVSDDLFAFPKG